MWIALGACCFTYQFYFLFDLPVEWGVLGLAFFATLGTYTFQRYIKLRQGRHGAGERKEWMKKHPILVLVILLISAVGLGCSLYFLSTEVFLLLVVCGFISFFYVVKIPGMKGRTLRDIPTLKIFLIGIVWSVACGMIPFLNHYQSFDLNQEHYFFFAYCFLFVLSITIPFDIRDLELDEKEKKTIPQLVGKQLAVILSIFLLMSALALLSAVHMERTILTYLFGIGYAFLIFRTREKQNDLYFSFVLDGLLVIQPLIFYLDLTYAVGTF